MVDLLKQNWGWISNNPWAFVSFAIIFLGVGWATAATFYRERIKLLEAGQRRRQGTTHARRQSSGYDYKDYGRYGRNILANGINDVRVGEPVSVQMDVPEGQTARFILRGPSAKNTGHIGAWDFNVVGVVNWKPGRQEDNTIRSKQLFSAEAGRADMELHFRVPGKVSIQMFKGANHKPDWVKSLEVGDVD